MHDGTGIFNDLMTNNTDKTMYTVPGGYHEVLYDKDGEVHARKVTRMTQSPASCVAILEAI
jgi:hypothetical protein